LHLKAALQKEIEMVQSLKSGKFSDSLKKQIYELNVWNDKAIEEN